MLADNIYVGYLNHMRVYPLITTV
jgi:hypothetical protein